MISLKAFKYRIYPSKQQLVLLNKTFGCVRVVWNHNVECFNKFDKNKTEQVQPLTTTLLRQKYEWMNKVSAAALQQKEIDFKSFKKNYFSKTRKKKLGRPQFKTKDNNQSFRLPNQKFTLLDNKIRLEKIGKIKIIIDREIPKDSKFMSVTISKNKCNQLFASVLVEIEVNEKPKTNRMIGLDIGIKTFLTGSNGLVVENPKYLHKNQVKLVRVQRNLSRKKKGSNRRKKARLKVARLHNKIVNQRQDFIHKITSELVNQYDFIAIEDLNVSGMVKNHKLAKAIADASFSEFYRVLSYKAKWYGKEVVKIDRWFASSKTCSCCGWKNEHLTLSDRTFVCESCGLELDRDFNASKNILKEALRVFNAIETNTDKVSIRTWSGQ